MASDLSTYSEDINVSRSNIPAGSNGDRLVMVVNQTGNEGPRIYRDGTEFATWASTSNSWVASNSNMTVGEDAIPVTTWIRNNTSNYNRIAVNLGINLTSNSQSNFEDSFQPFKTHADTTGSAGATGITTSSGPIYNVSVSVNVQGTEADEKAFSSEGILAYPQDHTQEDYDFIKIIPIEYVPALEDGIGGTGGSTTIDDEWFGFASIRNRYQLVKKVGSTVFLPMTPDSLSESNAVDWGSDTLNPLQAAGARIAFDTIGDAAKDPIEGVRTLIGSTGAAAQAFMNNPQMENFIKTYFAGKAVGATNLLGRAGVAINPNLEVLFNGPKLRTFSYNFKFTPRDENESRLVRRIIKLFKKTMAPKRRDKIFLTPPAVYKIQYIFNSETNRDHPFLNKIKPCALTTFNVNYAPDGSYMTYDDGSMSSYGVSMTFSELEPIYNDDIDDVDTATTGF